MKIFILFFSLTGCISILFAEGQVKKKKASPTIYDFVVDLDSNKKEQPREIFKITKSTTEVEKVLYLRRVSALKEHGMKFLAEFDRNLWKYFPNGWSKLVLNSGSSPVTKSFILTETNCNINRQIIPRNKSTVADSLIDKPLTKVDKERLKRLAKEVENEGMDLLD
jgi:hypothetical protein